MNKKNLLRFCGICILFCCFKTAVAYTACSSFMRVYIDARFERPEQVQVYYGANRRFNEARSKKTEAYPPGRRAVGKVDLNNHAARHLRLDLGESPGVARLYGLSLNSFFFPEIRFSASDIARRFVPGPGLAMRLVGDHVELVCETTDPYLQLRDALRHRGLFLSWLLPLVMAASAFLLFSGFSPRTFPAFADLLGKKQSSAGLHFAALDGIRGVAALLVLAVHVGLLPSSVGMIGVLLFFALSGFLLAIPFAKEPARAVSPSYMRDYMKRRLLRIIPMYYTVITVLFLFRHKVPDVFRHYLFLQGDGYLWTVPQEMFFYILLPFVVAALYALTRGCRPLGPVALLAAVIAVALWTRTGQLTLYGNGEYRPVMVGIFLSGMFFSFLYQTLRAQPFWDERSGALCRKALGIAGTAVLLLLLMAAYRLLPILPPPDPYRHFGLTGFLAAFVIFAVTAAPHSLLNRCMSFLPLRAVGVVSFSFYLLHPTIIVFCSEVSAYFLGIELHGMARLLVSGFVSYVFALLTYSWIEHPFMKH